MGMYNEVFDTCPNCGKHSGYMQISQIVLGFGEFNLADLAGLKRRYDEGDLSEKDLARLADALSDATFQCRDESVENEDDRTCYHSWRPDPAKILAVRMLARVNYGDTRARALQLLDEAGILSD